MTPTMTSPCPGARTAAARVRRGVTQGLSSRSSRNYQLISPEFSLELPGFSPGKHLIHFLVLKMKDFRNFVLHNAFSFSTLNKFTQNLKSPISRIRKLQ